MRDSELAHSNRGSFIAKTVQNGANGYWVVNQEGNTIKGVQASQVWPDDIWVTVITTNSGYSIVGTAGTGPAASVYDP